jgi:hypothetical protein
MSTTDNLGIAPKSCFERLRSGFLRASLLEEMAKAELLKTKN